MREQCSPPVVNFSMLRFSQDIPYVIIRHIALFDSRRIQKVPASSHFNKDTDPLCFEASLSNEKKSQNQQVGYTWLMRANLTFEQSCRHLGGRESICRCTQLRWHKCLRYTCEGAEIVGCKVCGVFFAFLGRLLTCIPKSVLKTFVPDECTHLVWSYGNEKQLKVAELYDIKAVSPLWVERCKQVLLALTNPKRAS